jgi:hypothetical protein
MWLSLSLGRLIAVIVVLAIAGAVVWAWRDARSSDPVSQEEALSQYREGAGGPRAARPGVPRQGVYTYRQSGGERGGAGPISVRRGLPGEARYVVTPIKGGFQEQLSLSEQHIEGVRFRVTRHGSWATWRRTDITFVGFGRDDRRDLRPAPLHLPRKLSVGLAWSGRYTAGELPVSYRAEVVRREAVEVGGRRLPSFVVRTTSDTGGAHLGRRVDVFWWSPRLALPLRWTIDMEIRGTVGLDSTADLRLEAAEPVT